MAAHKYLRILRTQWLLVVLGLVIGVGAAIAATVLTTRQYTTDVTIYVSALAPTDDPSVAYNGGLFSQQQVLSYEELVTGDRIAREVADTLDVGLAAGEISERVTASVVPETTLLTATVTDSSPERAALIANTLGEALSRLVAEIETPPGVDQAPLVTARVVEPADVPTSPASPNPVLNLALGVLVGLALGYGAGIARNALDTTIRSPAALTSATGAANLGVIPYDPKLRSGSLMLQDNQQGPRSEAFRQLRTNLQFIGVDQPRKALVVTSAVPAEGKTSVACTLAMAFAAAGGRVVLVEADLRRPGVAQAVGLGRAVGLTSVLTGRVSLDQALQPQGNGYLDVLASGPLPPNPSELLVSRRMEEVLDELRRRYDLVLLDTPPVLPVTDAAALAGKLDGAILVCRFGKTTTAAVKAAAAALSAVSAPLWGTVLNMDRDDHGGGYAGYGPYARSDAAPLLEDQVPRLPNVTRDGAQAPEAFPLSEPAPAGRTAGD